MKATNITVKCPQCGREVKAWLTGRFNVMVYSHPKMALSCDKSGHLTEDTKLDLQPGTNRAALMTSDIDCPMSYQPIE